MQVSSSLEEADVVAGMEDLKLTSKGGRALTLTPEQLRTMTRDQLIGIWKDYVNQLAVLLVELERGDTPAAGDTIKQYIEEVVSVLFLEATARGDMPTCGLQSIQPVVGTHDAPGSHARSALCEAQKA